MNRCITYLFCLVACASAQSDTWQQYILGPQSWTVYPKSIVSVSGNVINAEAILTESGTTTFTRQEGEDAPSIVLDFGINTVGFLNINFSGASTGASPPGIRLAFSETLQYLSDISDYTRSFMPGTPVPLTPGSDQIAVRSEAYSWTAAWGCQNGTQVCSDGLHGFRYMKIYLDALPGDSPLTQAFGTVNVSGLSLQYSAFLGTLDTYKGWFECSDPELTKYWYGAIYTNDIATDIFRETDCDPRQAYTEGLGGKLVLHDGAKRDRDPYIGDVAVSLVTTFLAHGNLSSEAAKNVIADLGDHQRDDGYIPSASTLDYGLLLFDYPLYWIISLYEYTLYTGDKAFLAQYYPNLNKTLNEYYPAHTSSSSNLISKPSGYGDYAFVGRDGEASYYNVLYVFALKRAAECATWVSDPERANEWLKRADVVAEAVNKNFWDESVGAYNNSATSSTHPQDANAIAVLAGVASSEQAKSALAYLNTATARSYGNAYLDDDSIVGGGSQRVYAFMSYFDLHARYTTGETASALDEIRRLYGWMYNQDPQYTYWEGVGAEGSMYQGAFTSAAHGWSTGIAGVLTNYILGITFFAPGGSAWMFDAKEVNEVTWAAGQVPRNNYEAINIRWENVNGTIEIEINSPVGTMGRARIPTTEDVRVIHNDQIVWSDGKSYVGNVYREEKGNVNIVDIEPGHHIIKAIPV